MSRFVWPLLLFLVLAGFLAVGLKLNPREVPSPLIDRPAPPFNTVALSDPERVVRLEEMRGKVWILNVWASWCAACLEEHPVLMDYARRGTVPIYGLNYKDEPKAGLQWLRRHGDPYADSLVDRDGRIGIDYGVYGVPETFVIDRQGVIRMKHVGPLTAQVVTEKIDPLVRRLDDD